MAGLVRTGVVTVLFALLVLAVLSLVAARATVTHGASGLVGSSTRVAATRPAPLSRGGVVSSGSILGRPSLSAAFINRVLAAYNSPAVGLGSVLYAESLRYGIDDAYPLAFFLHESSMGRAGMANATHSLGNIRCTPGWSCLGGYRFYASWSAGFHDWFTLITAEYLPRGLSTIPTIIPVYAPNADHNDERGYIAAVLSAVSVWRSGRVLI